MLTGRGDFRFVFVLPLHCSPPTLTQQYNRCMFSILSSRDAPKPVIKTTTKKIGELQRSKQLVSDLNQQVKNFIIHNTSHARIQNTYPL